MNVQELRNDYYGYSRKASDVARQLAFAGIAVVWLFHIENHGEIYLYHPLVWALGFLVLTLALDLLHYATSTAIWGIFHRIKEKAYGPNSREEFDAPPRINWPGLVIFWAKLSAVAIAYIFLLIFFASKIHVQ